MGRQIDCFTRIAGASKVRYLASCGWNSYPLLSLVDSSAAWVYLNRGAVLPMIAVPSVVGMMLGARIGASLLHVLKGSVIRKMVITLLLFAGMRALLKGLGVWV